MSSTHYARRALNALVALSAARVQARSKKMRKIKAKRAVTALSPSAKYVLQQALDGDTKNLDMVPRLLRELSKGVDKTVDTVVEDIEHALKQNRPELVKVLLKRIKHLL